MAMTEQNRLAYGQDAKEEEKEGPGVPLSSWNYSPCDLKVFRRPLLSSGLPWGQVFHCSIVSVQLPTILPASLLSVDILFLEPHFSFSKGKFSRWPVTICLPLIVWVASGYQNVEVGMSKGVVGNSQWEHFIDISSKIPHRKQGIASNYPKILQDRVPQAAGAWSEM